MPRVVHTLSHLIFPKDLEDRFFSSHFADDKTTRKIKSITSVYIVRSRQLGFRPRRLTPSLVFFLSTMLKEFPKMIPLKIMLPGI